MSLPASLVGGQGNQLNAGSSATSGGTASNVVNAGGITFGQKSDNTMIIAAALAVAVVLVVVLGGKR